MHGRYNIEKERFMLKYISHILFLSRDFNILTHLAYTWENADKRIILSLFYNTWQISKCPFFLWFHDQNLWHLLKIVIFVSFLIFILVIFRLKFTRLVSLIQNMHDEIKVLSLMFYVQVPYYIYNYFKYIIELLKCNMLVHK